MSPLSSPVEVTRHHPCFDEQAHDRVGRIHLPVAPRCNIRCLFCERRVCANLQMQHPGWARRLMSPQEALQLVRRLVEAETERPGSPHGSSTEGLFVVGVAGPGEPLANEGTFEALELVHRAFPSLVKCVSTNGLLLERALPRLILVGVRALTVTVNAPDNRIGSQIYAWVRHDGETYRGREAAELLIAHQMAGIRTALDAGLAVKVNTVLIPRVNDRHVSRLAWHLRDIGVPLMNLMPLIPGGAMRHLRAPTCQELRQARLACEEAIPQFRRCEQCRADVIRLPQSLPGSAPTRHAHPVQE